MSTSRYRSTCLCPRSRLLLAPIQCTNCNCFIWTMINRDYLQKLRRNNWENPHSSFLKFLLLSIIQMLQDARIKISIEKGTNQQKPNSLTQKDIAKQMTRFSHSWHSKVVQSQLTRTCFKKKNQGHKFVSCILLNKFLFKVIHENYVHPKILDYEILPPIENNCR
jgi:hypothetical protein